MVSNRRVAASTRSAWCGLMVWSMAARRSARSVTVQAATDSSYPDWALSAADRAERNSPTAWEYELSAAATLVPRVKRAVQSVAIPECRELVEDALKLNTASEILGRCLQLADNRYGDLLG